MDRKSTQSKWLQFCTRATNYCWNWRQPLIWMTWNGSQNDDQIIWFCFLPLIAWNRCSSAQCDDEDFERALHYFLTVLLAFVLILALAFATHTTIFFWKNKMKKKQYFQINLKLTIKVFKNNWIKHPSVTHLLFCYINRFIQYNPNCTFPASRMCCRSFICHVRISVWN